MLNMGIYRNSRCYGASDRPHLVFRLTLRGEPLMSKRLDWEQVPYKSIQGTGTLYGAHVHHRTAPFMVNLKSNGAGARCEGVPV
jgi:hypothetical protein